MGFQQDYTPRAAVDPLTKLNAESVAKVLPDFLKRAAGLKFTPSDLLHEVRYSDLEMLAKEISPSHRSVNSADFAMAMSDALCVLLAESWLPLATQLDPLVRNIILENFKETKVVSLEMPALSESIDDIIEDQPAPARFYPPVLSSSIGAIKTYESILKVSNQVWQTHGAALTRAIAGYAFKIANLEVRLLTELLVSNPLLADGNALFLPGTNAANPSCTLPATLETLSKVNESLLTAGGGALSGFLAAPAAAIYWRDLLHKSGFTEVAVIASPDLPVNHWYAFSNPAETVSIARLRLAGNMPPSGGIPMPTIGWVRIPKTMAYGYSAFYDCGFSAVSRKGIYRGVSPL